MIQPSSFHFSKRMLLSFIHRAKNSPDLLVSVNPSSQSHGPRVAEAPFCVGLEGEKTKTRAVPNCDLVPLPVLSQKDKRKKKVQGEIIPQPQRVDTSNCVLKISVYQFMLKVPIAANCKDVCLQNTSKSHSYHLKYGDYYDFVDR